MDDLALASASSLADAVRRRRLSSRELLDMYLRRIEHLNPAINAVVTIDAERASVAAGAADERTASGEALGPLHGLPVTIKDAIETAGLRSTGGARELSSHVPQSDAPAVGRLRAAGAVVVGKTNVPRWSGDLQTFNDLFGTTSNPWDLACTPGGSSGGAAAAVAAGLTSFEMGTDIGGSVRIPSSYCGVFGHKPSFGVVPQAGYLDRAEGRHPGADINVFGPIARSAEDLDLLLGVLAGARPEDAAAWSLELPPPRHGDNRRYRVGTWFDDPACEVDRAVVAALQAAADALSDSGVRVEDERPPLDLGEVYGVFNGLLLPAISVSVEQSMADALSGTHRAWLDLDEQRSGLRAVWADWFERFDALLCPVMPMPAFPHDHHGSVADRSVTINGRSVSQADTLAWTGLAGVAYLPATVVPVGRTPGGLPVGMQVVGPWLGDRTSLFLGARTAEATGGYVPPPMARLGVA